MPFMKIKGFREARARAFDEKICSGGRDFTNFENLALGFPGRGMVTLGND